MAKLTFLYILYVGWVSFVFRCITSYSIIIIIRGNPEAETEIKYCGMDIDQWYRLVSRYVWLDTCFSKYTRVRLLSKACWKAYIIRVLYLVVHSQRPIKTPKEPINACLSIAPVDLIVLIFACSSLKTSWFVVIL